MKKIVSVIAFSCAATLGHSELITNDLDSKLPSDPRELYTDLVQRAVVNSIYSAEDTSCDPTARERGEAWPKVGHTMIGRDRLRNIHFCLKRILLDKIPGDCIEAGAWRGGATILMRAILKAYGDTQRKVWVADSFEGFPVPNPERYPADEGASFEHFKELAASMEHVQENFKRYGLLDKQVYFLKGYFHDTLPYVPIGPIALLRLDGDLYQSTMDTLENLYPKVSPGGFIIVDDFGSNASCSKAVLDYRAKHNIKEPIGTIDWTGVYWRKSLDAQPDGHILQPITEQPIPDPEAPNVYDWTQGRWEK